MKFLKYIVVFMVILIFLSTVFLVYILFNKLNSDKVFNSKQDTTTYIDVDVQNIKDVELSDDKVLLDLITISGKREIIIFDLKKDRIIKRLKFK